MAMTQFTYSQEFVKINITQQNDLPSNTVYDIFQDSKGFIWVATENGLARYNGIHFKSYENADIRSQAMSHITEDEDGRVWLHNFFGEILYVENNQLEKLYSWENFYKSGFPALSNYGDTLIANSNTHIYYYHTNTKTWNNILELKSDSQNLNKHVNYEHHIVFNENVWVCYYVDNQLFISALLEPGKKIEIDISNFPISKNIWRLTSWGNTLLIFDGFNKRLFEFKSGVLKEITSQYKDILHDIREVRSLSDDEIAFIGPSGCYLKKKNTEVIQIAPGKNVSSITKDNEGAYWLGTLNEGIFYFPSLDSKIYGGTFTKLEVDKKHKRIIAGGYDGSLSVYSYDGKLEQRIPAIYPKEVQSMLVDTAANKLLYFGRQLYQLSLETFEKQNYLPVTATKSIFKIEDYYGLATSSGFCSFDLKNNKITRLGIEIRLSSGVYDAKNGVTWLGSQKGVIKVDMDNLNSVPWKPDDSEYSPGISRSVVDDNYIVLGTYTNGLYIIKDDKILNHLTSVNGLLSNRITALKMKYPNVYIGTDQGISIYEIDSKEITNINYEKGLIGNEIHDIVTTNGGLWISHVGGLQKFEGIPGQNKIKPIIHVSKIISSDSIFSTKKNSITLPPDMRQLTVHFDVSNNFKSHGKAKIVYRIKGVDNEWNQTTLTTPVANYLSLPSGEYVLEAYAQNEDGIGSSNRLSLPVFVIAPFWETAWFITLIILVSTLLVGVLVYYRLKLINRRNIESAEKHANEQELRIAQLTSIRAQMNPHFIFNTMSLIQSKVVSGFKDKASTTINDFSTLMRKVLDFSGREMITLHEEVEVIEKFLAIERERFENELDYTIEVDEALQHEMIKIPSLLTQPYVENALRHGLLHKEGNKQLNITIKLEGELVVITVRDNGVGRKASMEINKSRKKEHTSFALEAYNRRIELLNSNRKHKITLEIIDEINKQGKAAGTTVIITLPLDDEPIKSK